MTQRAFTYSGLVAAMASTGVVVGLLMPAIAARRENMRAEQCRENLRLIGQAAETHAQRDPQVRLTTGAFDYFRDGCPDTWGWAADVAKVGEGRPSQMLCPVNPARGSETLRDLLAVDGLGADGTMIENAAAKNGVIPKRLAEGNCAPFRFSIDGTIPPESLGTLEAGAEREVIVREIVQSGFNTNYAQSWFAARGTIKMTNDPSLENRLVCRGKQTFHGGAYPGLPQRMAEKSKIASSAIPLLGDAATTDVARFVPALSAPEALGAELRGGDALARSFNNGPSYYDDESDRLISLDRVVTLGSGREIGGALKHDTLPLPSNAPSDLPDGGVDVTGDSGFDPITNLTYGGSDERLWLQDTRAFAAIHGSGRDRSCNVSFADGSVKTVLDLNGDGFLNPGFPIARRDVGNGSQAAKSIGYTNARAEIGPGEMYNGPFIDDSYIRSHGCELRTPPPSTPVPENQMATSDSPGTLN